MSSGRSAWSALCQCAVMLGAGIQLGVARDDAAEPERFQLARQFQPPEEDAEQLAERAGQSAASES